MSFAGTAVAKRPIDIPDMTLPDTAPATTWGQKREFANRHAQAARLQARHPGYIIWFGEHTGNWFVLDRNGLQERGSLEELTDLLKLLRTHVGLQALGSPR